MIVDEIRSVDRIQEFLDLRKILLALRAEMVLDLGKAFGNFTITRHLAIENS